MNIQEDKKLSKKDKKRNSKLKNALFWSWEFTKLIIVILTIVYILQMIFSAFIIFYSLKFTSSLMYLDSFITETNETFRLIVGANVVKACVENVFKYNDFGGKGMNYNSTNGNSENINNESDASEFINSDL